MELYFNSTDTTTLEEIRELAEMLLATTFKVQPYRYEDAMEINLANLGWKFVFDNGKRRFGCCKPRYKTISVSRVIASMNLNKAMKIEDTIRHEIAHALQFVGYGYSNHDRMWTIIAKSIGSNGERCYNAEKEGLKMQEGKYTAYCTTEGCNHETQYHKFPRVVSEGRRACGKCCDKYNNGKFSHDYVLQYRQNY